CLSERGGRGPGSRAFLPFATGGPGGGAGALRYLFRNHPLKSIRPRCAHRGLGGLARPRRGGRWSLCFLSWRVLLMALSWLHRLLKRKSGPVCRTGRKKPGPARFVPAVEPLAERVLPAVTATFLPGAGTLAIFGDALDNTITVSRDAAGTILVNGGAVAIQGGAATVANTALIQVFGQAGNDQIALDET